MAPFQRMPSLVKEEFVADRRPQSFEPEACPPQTLRHQEATEHPVRSLFLEDARQADEDQDLQTTPKHQMI
ncbi:hypothetical protein HK405_014023, partial [Cladochytrium tenue]